MRTHEPAYLRVVRALRASIELGRWSDGKSLPSRQELAREFSVSVGTVQQAIDNLIQSGTVRTEHGRGTYVAESAECLRLNDTYEQEGKVPLRVTVIAGIRPEVTISHQDMGVLTIVDALERGCGKMGGSVSYCKREFEGGNWEQFSRAIGRFDWSQSDAAVVVAIHKSIDPVEDFSAAARSIPVPLVCLAPGELPASIPHVYYDNRYGGYLAAMHLLDKGHNDLTFVSPYKASWTRERLAGVEQALDQRGLGHLQLDVRPAPAQVRSVDDIGYVSYELTRQMAYDCSRSALKAAAPPKAVIAVNDATALGYMDAARELGLEMGKDYSITGFDNTNEAREAGLTSFQRPWEAMAEEAVRVAFAMARGQHAATQVRMPPHLVPRHSTARAKWDLRSSKDPASSAGVIGASKLTHAAS